MTTTGKLIGMIKFSLLVSGVLTLAACGPRREKNPKKSFLVRERPPYMRKYGLVVVAVGRFWPSTSSKLELRLWNSRLHAS